MTKRNRLFKIKRNVTRVLRFVVWVSDIVSMNWAENVHQLNVLGPPIQAKLLKVCCLDIITKIPTMC